MPYLLKNAFQVVTTLERTAQVIKNSVNSQFKALNYNISYEQWEVIQSIGENEGCTQIEIAKSSHKGPASISRTIILLSKKGVLKKQKDPKNKRVNRVFLTAKGKKLFAKARLTVEEVSKGCLENIFDRELNLFIKILDRIQNKVR